jgi:group I intron endonuclease
MANLKNIYKYYFIYMIKNLLNNKCYIGFHASNKEYDKDNYYSSSKLLNKSIKKYGSQNFVMGIIEYVNVKNWKEKERYWIIKMNAHTSLGGYNLTWGGDGSLGLKWTEKSKHKKGELMKGNKHSSEQNERHSKFMKGRVSPMKGRISSRKGIKLDQKIKQKMSISKIGVKQSEETIKKKKTSLILYYKNNIDENGQKIKQFKTYWITNEKKDKKIYKDDLIPDGWRIGRKLKYT